MLLRRTPARVEREKEVDGVVTPDNIEKLVSKHDKTIGADGEEEFGGLQALCWGLICGFEVLLPYWYVCFFVPMIVHRAVRDDARCAEKYGADWDAYTQRVPYVFVPGVV
jgi:hypothetical protein